MKFSFDVELPLPYAAPWQMGMLDARLGEKHVQRTICTIGYQGKAISDFVQELVMSGVEVLIDVRRRPLSRKRGFSKTSLRNALAEQGIDYFHAPNLGMPVELFQYRNDKDNGPILREYGRRLPSQSAEIVRVIEVSKHRRSCLLCFEADQHQCHRGVLADEIFREADLRPEHL